MASYNDIAWAYQNWPEWQAMADFNSAMGGDYNRLLQARGMGGGNSNEGGGYTPISAPDLAKLREQVAGIIHPYYQKLAVQANGNFDEAVRLMKGDYSQGVKQAKEDFALAERYGTGELNTALANLGVDFRSENEKKVDELNKRGMAVYEGERNVVTPATFNPTYNTTSYSFSPGVSGTSPNMTNLGRGGVEAERLRKAQSLRAEATMRAGMKPLEQAGLTMKQKTSSSGFNPERPLDFKGDMSQLGAEETNLMQRYQPAKNQLVSTLQRLPQEEAQDINSIAGGYAGLGVKNIDTNLQNQLQKQYTSDFVMSGLA